MLENPWKSLGSKVPYENRWIRVTEHQVINPSGGEGIYGVVHYKHIAIGIIPLDEEKNTWIVGQYRLPLNEYSWEIPEGGGQMDSPILDSAKRELLEETGIVANEWRHVLTMHLSNSVSDEVGHVFIARDLSFQQAQPEETEQLTIQKIPFDLLFEWTMQGKITDSLSVAGIFKVKHLMLLGLL